MINKPALPQEYLISLIHRFPGSKVNLETEKINLEPEKVNLDSEKTFPNTDVEL